LAVRGAIAGPYQLSQGCSTRPYESRYSRVINRLRLERCLGADNVFRLGLSEVGSVVDTLPGLIRCALGAAVTTVIEIHAAWVRVRLYVGILVGDLATPATI
jgi:hypothetical protein